MTLMNVLKYLWMNMSEIIFSVSVVVLSYQLFKALRVVCKSTTFETRES